jgi:signal peptidase II
MVAVAAADLASKSLAPVLGARVELNRDLSLGVAGGSAAALLAVMAAGLVAVGVLAWRELARGAVPWWPVALALGGAVGNFTDRLITGAVRDFVPLGPVLLNGADAAVAVGLCAWLVCWSRSRRPAVGAVRPHPPVPTSPGRG